MEQDRTPGRVARLIKFIPALLAKLIGSLAWTAPPWWRVLRERIEASGLKARVTAPFAAVRAWARTHPRKFRLSILGIVTAMLASAGGYLWYQALPRPMEFSVDISAPGPTKLEDNARPDPVHIQFGGSAAPLEQVGRPVTQGVEIKPPVSGEWRWANDAQLTFIPREDWAVNQEYRVRLDRSLFPNHVRLRRYELSFATAPFTASISQMEFYQDLKNPKLKKVVATVRFSHPVDSAELEKRIALRLAGQKEGFLGLGAENYPFTVSYNKFKGEAYIHSDPVQIPPKDTQMTLAIAAGVRSERGGDATKDKLERQVAIPGMFNYFRVQSASLALPRNERHEPEQALVVRVTDGVLEDELHKALKVYLLPRDLPPLAGQPERKAYHWRDVQQIGPEVLRESVEVVLQALPTDREFATLHSFKYQAEPGRYLYIRIPKGVQSAGGYQLAKDFDTIQRVPEFPKELNILYDGAVLSLNGEKKVTVVARDVAAVRFEIGRVIPGQINHLVSQTGGAFHHPHFSNYNFGEENITERFSEVRELRQLDPGKTQYVAMDLGSYLTADPATGVRRGLFFFRAEAWDSKKKRATGVRDARLLLVTDLGIIVKDHADGSHTVFAQSIASGRPVAGAQVQVLGKNGLPVVSATTDDDGRAALPKLSDFTHEKQPTVYLVRRGDDLSFLPFDRGDRRLNFSRFDIGGEVTGQQAERLSAYLFSERGIYRPGDPIHVGLIVKSLDWRVPLAGVPIETVVTDARGLEVYKKKIALSAAGFEELRYATEETAPTGNYQVAAYIVKDDRRASLLGSATVRVEEFLPDRLKIGTRFSQERAEGWVAPKDLKGRVKLMNLFGTPAANRRVAASLTLAPAYPVFRQYRDYQFNDPLRAKNSFSERLPDAQTDEQGETEFVLNLERFEKATYRVSFLAEGYEAAGGRGVVSESSALVSPLAYLVGYKADGDLHYIKRDSARALDFLAIDPALKQVAVAGLKTQLIELRYVSVLTQQQDGTYKYESVRREIPLAKRDLAIALSGHRYALPTGKPGDYALVVRDAEDTELHRIAFSVVGLANVTRALDKAAELQVKLAKADYAAGEEIEVSIVAPYTGAGLITIERDKVYAQQWFKTATTSSVQRIRVPASLEGNGYVNVAFVRAMDSPEIFMSPLSYGVAPFSVSKAKRTNNIELEAPDLVRPGETLRIKYKTRQPGRIVLFAVDEGILQVAKYPTPDPLAHFYRKRALEVQTAQILDLILPEFKQIQAALSAPGGDAGALEAIGKNLNPFKRRRDKPVVYWSGMLTSDGTPREVTYQVPDYFNGTLRVMAVAVSPEAIGVAQKKATVRGHFVLSPNAPTTVAPGDEFEVSVGLANNVEGSGEEPEIKLDLKVSEHLEVVGGDTQTLKVGEGRETVVVFKLKARNELGSGNLTFSAALGGKKARHSVDLSVRPPLPYMTTVSAGHFKSGKVEVATPRRMYPHYRKLEASASPVPLTLAHGLVSYLNKFPYGCTEQLVSQAFPAIVLRNRPEFGYAPDKIEANLERVLLVLRARQNAEGAFGFWAANSHVSDFQTAYAAHFLTEAKEKGYPVPPEVLGKAVGYLRALAAKETESLADARTRAYAVYVLTRNGIVTSGYLTTLRKHLEDSHTKAWKKDLAGVYLAATYELLKQRSEAESLIDESRLGDVITPDYDNFYDDLARDAQYLYIVARHFPERLQKLKGEDLIAFVKPITQGRFNTISSSYTILALDAYVANVAQAEAAQIAMAELLANKQERVLVLPKTLFASAAFTPEADAVRIASPSDYPVFYQATQAGFDLAPPEKEIKQKLEVQREYRNAKGDVVTQARLGEELTVHVKLRAIEGGAFQNVAIVDLLPGGFEVVMDSLPRGGMADAGYRPDYVDIREDRVVIFGTVSSSVQEFTYRTKATNKGRYAIPPVFAESMYDRAVQARGVGGRMSVDGN